MVPYVFHSEIYTPEGYPMSKKLAVTTKGYCVKRGHVVQQPIRGAQDCLDLDLGDDKFDVRPGDEILVWFEFDGFRSSSHPNDDSLDQIDNLYLEVGQRPATTTNEDTTFLPDDKQNKGQPWYMILHPEHSFMRRVQDLKNGMLWKACAKYSKRERARQLLSGILFMAYINLAIEALHN